MEIIAEKINGTRKEVKAAVASRDAVSIQELARTQARAGATYIDVNAGTGKSEPDDLIWLVETIQPVVDIPLCLDSASASALAAALPRTEKLPMVNSISGEKSRLEGVLPLVAEYQTPVIALAADDSGVSKEPDQRLQVIRRVVEATRAAGVADELVYVDPLVMSLAGFEQSGFVTLETMRVVKTEFPRVKLAVGLSNLSFGLPARSLINRVFLAFAVEAGLDAALVDPNDRALMQELVAAELVLGRDSFCRQYTQAYRGGRFGFEGKGKGPSR